MQLYYNESPLGSIILQDASTINPISCSFYWPTHHWRQFQPPSYPAEESISTGCRSSSTISRIFIFLSSPLQRQANCLHAIHKAIQQFNQHLKADQLDRKTLQLIALQLQDDFALLRYLLSSSVETTSISDTAIKNSATNPLIYLKPNTNPNPTSTAFPLPCDKDPKTSSFTPVGAVGPPRTKATNSLNANFQSSTITLETPPVTAWNVTSRIYKLKKFLADEIVAYISITTWIHSQYFFLYDKIRHLEAGNSDVIF